MISRNDLCLYLDGHARHTGMHTEQGRRESSWVEQVSACAGCRRRGDVRPHRHTEMTTECYLDVCNLWIEELSLHLLCFDNVTISIYYTVDLVVYMLYLHPQLQTRSVAS